MRIIGYNYIGKIMKSYFEQRNEKNVVKVREICQELPDFVTRFFLGIQLKTTPLTRLNYAYDLRIFFDYLSKVKYRGKIPVIEISMSDIDMLKSTDIELFLDYLSSYEFQGNTYSCGEKAKSRKLSTLRTFFKYFYRKDELKSDVAAKIDMPKLHDQAIIRLDADEIARILDTAEDGLNMSDKQKQFNKITSKRDVAILTLFLGTGIRISELVGIDVKDVDFNSNAFTVTRKGGSQSTLYFSDEVANALREYLLWRENEIESASDIGNKMRDNPALFLSLQGNRIAVRSVELLVKKYSRLINPLKKITPHKLRSTFGTQLYRETQDIYMVADVLGHKDINTTKRHYAAMSEDIRRQAATKVKLRDNDDE